MNFGEDLLLISALAISSMDAAEPVMVATISTPL